MGKTAEELRREIDQRRSDLTRDFEAIGDKVSPGRAVERRTEAVKSRFRTMRESVMGKADDLRAQAHDSSIDLRERAGGTAEGFSSTAHDTVESVRETAGELPDRMREQAQGNPLAAGLVAFGLGLLAASVLPSSRREQRLAHQVQPHLEDAARTAAGTGREMAEEIKPALQESAGHLQESARESVQHVTGQAKDAAESVGAEARDAAEHVKDTARSS